MSIVPKKIVCYSIERPRIMTNPVAMSTPGPKLQGCKTISRMLMRPEFSGETDVEKNNPLVVPGSRKITKTTPVKPKD